MRSNELTMYEMECIINKIKSDNDFMLIRKKLHCEVMKIRIQRAINKILSVMEIESLDIGVPSSSDYYHEIVDISKHVACVKVVDTKYYSINRDERVYEVSLSGNDDFYIEMYKKDILDCLELLYEKSCNKYGVTYVKVENNNK